MSIQLKIGHRLMNGDQIISALIQYKMFEDLIGQVIVDEVINAIPLSRQEIFQGLGGEGTVPIAEQFEHFLRQWCQQRGYTAEYFSSVILRDLRVEKFKQMAFADQVESEFLRCRSELDQVEYSVIQVADPLLAHELYYQLRDDGVNFARLAQQYSRGKERETGGWVGPVAVSTLPSQVVQLFRRGMAGLVYGPVPVYDQFWLVRLEHLMSARLNQATRTLLMNRLYARWLQSHIKAAIARPGAIAVAPISPSNAGASEVPSA